MAEKIFAIECGCIDIGLQGDKTQAAVRARHDRDKIYTTKGTASFEAH